MQEEDKTPVRTRKRPNQKRSKETFKCILLGAAKILEKEGLKKFNTNHIAKVAGVSVGTLYQYFPSKESVLVELVNFYFKEQDEQLIKYFHQSQLDPDDIAGSLTQVFDKFYEILLSQPQISRFLMQQIESFKLQQLLEELDSRMAQEVKNLFDKYGVGKNTNIWQLRLFIVSTKAINDFYYANSHRMSVDEAKKMVTQNLLNLL